MLIALVIIGIIAAITIPNVLLSTRKHEIVSKLKKAHSTMSQAMIKIAMEEGVPVGDYSLMDADDFFDSFAETVNTVKRCNSKTTGCFTEGIVRMLSGNVWNQKISEPYSLVTADGIAYGWKSDADICSNKGISDEDLENCKGRFLVDVNAGVSPNRFGYDIFFFVVVQDKGIVPAGAGNNSKDCKRGNGGITCAAKVLREGEISYL